MAVPVCVLILALAHAAAPPAAGTYVRPKSAVSVKLSMVPAFPPCTAPNRQHGPPLEFPSCNPAFHASTALTFGSPDANGAPANSEGHVKLVAQAGNPGPPDDSDVLMQASVSDVRCLPGTTACADSGSPNVNDGPDYTGQLRPTFMARITDRFNATEAGGGTDPATSIDLTLSFFMACTTTVSSSVGSTCGANTSINAIVPGWITDGKRTVFELGQVSVLDGGQDGASGTDPNTTLLTQGVFVR
jgi:hypothetical protein